MRLWLLLGFSIAGTGTLVAQTPRQITAPVRTLSIDLISAKSYTMGSVRYVRAGLKPIEFRMGPDANLANLPWQPFTEGTTTTVTVGGRTAIQGDLMQAVGGQTGGGCPTYHVLVRVYLQFRARVQIGQYAVSPIRGDTSCVSLGG